MKIKGRKNIKRPLIKCRFATTENKPGIPRGKTNDMPSIIFVAENKTKQKWNLEKDDLNIFI